MLVFSVTKNITSKSVKLLTGITTIFTMLSAFNSHSQNIEFGYYADQKKTADLAFSDLHDAYNKKNFDAIYKLSHPKFQAQITESKAIESMNNTYRNFGSVIESKQIAEACFPFQVRSIYHTKFVKAEGTEMIIWFVKNGKAQLLSMQISPGYAPAPDKVANKCINDNIKVPKL